MPRRKNVRFDYFKVNAREYNQERDVMEDVPCDLSDLFQGLNNTPVVDRVYRLGDDQARLQGMSQNNDKWELHFVRIRKNGFPIKTHDDGTYGYFEDLDEEEGFGEEVSVLYDPTNYVIMVRRNMHSLAPSAIANYLTDVIDEPGFTLYFKPLIHPRATDLLEEDHLIRGAEISVADIKNARDTTRRSLGQMITRANDMNESVSVTFKISIQQEGSRKHSRLPVYEELGNLVDDPSVQSIKVRRKADEDAKVEPIDLIKHRLIDYSAFTENDISPLSRNILHTTVIGRMHRLYRERVGDINNVYV
ncbi:hypothetical protein SAMN04487936_107211 [Halobacillus dabanensis]|uniref:Uncharacterized protein n=1 Tax=Halobacillus dabanensis TaxID=240302 RepID=A0A1I3WYJ0_HALDA|nr:DUF6731 family protein [Halobacillus dabanensis]SFK12433.1 hypothetical protein SAMN04487936_107211 [Halobacillus dabanensis]